MPSSALLTTSMEYQKAFLNREASFMPLWLNGAFGSFLARLTEKRVAMRPCLNPQTESAVVVMHSGGLWSTINLVRHLILGHQVHAVHILSEQSHLHCDVDIQRAWDFAHNSAEIPYQSPLEKALASDFMAFGKHARAKLTYTTVEVPGVWDEPRLTPVMLYLVGLVYGLRVSCGFTHRDIPIWLPQQLAACASEFHGQPVKLTSLTMNATPMSLLLDYVESKGRAETLKSITSCVKPVGNMHCGTCWPCYRRYRAFQDAGWLFDFHTPPWDGKDAQKHENRWLKGPGRVKGV